MARAPAAPPAPRPCPRQGRRTARSSSPAPPAWPTTAPARSPCAAPTAPPRTRRTPRATAPSPGRLRQRRQRTREVVLRLGPGQGLGGARAHLRDRPELANRPSEHRRVARALTQREQRQPAHVRVRGPRLRMRIPREHGLGGIERGDRLAQRLRVIEVLADVAQRVAECRLRLRPLAGAFFARHLAHRLRDVQRRRPQRRRILRPRAPLRQRAAERQLRLRP